MRRRLAFVTVAVTSLIVLAFVVPLGILARRQAEDRTLSAAERDAQSIATAVAVTTAFAGPGVTVEAAAAVLNAFGRPESASIHLADGTVVGDGVAGDPDVAVARNGSAFTARTDSGAAVLVPILTDGVTAVVRVAVSAADLSKGVSSAWTVLALLALTLIGIAAVAADRLGRSIVEPVERLRAAAIGLAAGELGTRVEPGGPPEVVQVAHTFNELAERLGEFLQDEREAAADLSHGLRTPLTALRLQVEGLPQGPEKDALLDDVDLVERAVDRVISDARSRGSDAPRSADLTAIARERAAFWSALAVDQQRRLEIDVPASALNVHATKDDIGRVLDTLMENVFAHTEPGTEISITVTSTGVLLIEDGGAGFEPSAAERGASGGGSTGLGLDIVQRITDRNGGTLTIDASPLGGARVSVAFRTRS